MVRFTILCNSQLTGSMVMGRQKDRADRTNRNVSRISGRNRGDISIGAASFGLIGYFMSLMDSRRDPVYYNRPYKILRSRAVRFAVEGAVIILKCASDGKRRRKR